jgi:hypothetical protein
MLKMKIPKIPIDITGHQWSSSFKTPRQSPNANSGRYVKIKTRFAAVAHRFNAGLPLKISHHAIPKMSE